ncbi:hypothetical protein LINPERPRIM_LOCUS16660 [Linum perenne]
MFYHESPVKRRRDWVTACLGPEFEGSDPSAGLPIKGTCSKGSIHDPVLYQILQLCRIDRQVTVKRACR